VSNEEVNIKERVASLAKIGKYLFDDHRSEKGFTDS